MSVKANDWIHAAATDAAAKLREKLDSLDGPSPRPRCSTAHLIESKENKAQEVTNGYSK